MHDILIALGIAAGFVLTIALATGAALLTLELRMRNRYRKIDNLRHIAARRRYGRTLV